MALTREQNGMDLCGDELYVEEMCENSGGDLKIASSKRINIDYAKEAMDFLWRYTIEGNPYLSIKESSRRSN